MLSDEIKTVHAALGALAGKVGPEEWELVRLCRNNLLAANLAAAELERCFVPAPEAPHTITAPQEA